ncbi:MAG: hypothetical protein A2Y93_05795 [Chloroflexi bacterium RBG_13_68_17]|nr:MAG: hypothetical protein A2Y93_05795 [Chloroflexi bacterium RBG_13_68_17]
MNSQVSSDERLMAALAHASVVLSGPGILVGVLIWLTQREKAAYASRQGLQAAVYQLLGMVVFVALWVVWGIFYAITTIPMIREPERYQDGPPPIFWAGIISMALPLLLMVAWGLYGLWGALKCYSGQEFRYAILGKRLLG